MPFSAETVYHVVSDVDAYRYFLPWCTGSQVHSRSPDGTYMEAELVIGTFGIQERYMSKVMLDLNRSVVVDASDSPLFHHLTNEWRFEPIGSQQCRLHFVVDFAFRSSSHSYIANMFFASVVQKLVGAFQTRIEHLSSIKSR